MRRHLDLRKLKQFMEELGKRATSPGTVYLTGGATALLLGFREQTVDVDIKLDPEPGGAFQAIAALKESLELSVKLAAPDQFIPPLPGWEERSQFIATEGNVTFRHFDFYSQCLAKIERGHTQDLNEVRSFVVAGLVEPKRLLEMFGAIRSELIRYPAIAPEDFEAKVRRFVAETSGDAI